MDQAQLVDGQIALRRRQRQDALREHGTRGGAHGA
jgi:hypothetical protein